MRRRRWRALGRRRVAVTSCAVPELADRDRLAVEGGDDAGVLGAVLDAVAVGVGVRAGRWRTSTSSPSLRPSLSESALLGLVPSLNSSRFLSPSLSASLLFQEPFRWCLAAKAVDLRLLRRGRSGDGDQGEERREGEGAEGREVAHDPCHRPTARTPAADGSTQSSAPRATVAELPSPTGRARAGRRTGARAGPESRSPRSPGPRTGARAGVVVPYGAGAGRVGRRGPSRRAGAGRAAGARAVAAAPERSRRAGRRPRPGR